MSKGKRLRRRARGRGHGFWNPRPSELCHSALSLSLYAKPNLQAWMSDDRCQMSDVRCQMAGVCTFVPLYLCTLQLVPCTLYFVVCAVYCVPCVCHCALCLVPFLLLNDVLHVINSQLKCHVELSALNASLLGVNFQSLSFNCLTM